MGCHTALMGVWQQNLSEGKTLMDEVIDFTVENEDSPRQRPTFQQVIDSITTTDRAIQFCQDNCLKVLFEWGNGEGGDGSIESEWDFGNHPCVTVYTGRDIDKDLIQVDALDICEAVKRYIKKASELNHRMCMDGWEIKE